jgi:hypothetical protein
MNYTLLIILLIKLKKKEIYFEKRIEKSKELTTKFKNQKLSVLMRSLLQQK